MQRGELINMLSLNIMYGLLVSHVAASIIPRADPPFQTVPSKATTPDNKFAINKPEGTGQPGESGATPNAVYGPHSIGMSEYVVAKTGR